MLAPLPHRRHAFQDACASPREGRDCEGSHRLTVLLLFPRLNAWPGAWLLLLAAACSYVAVRALEMGGL